MTNSKDIDEIQDFVYASDLINTGREIHNNELKLVVVVLTIGCIAGL